MMNVKVANQKDHQGEHICYDGRRYYESCLVMDAKPCPKCRVWLALSWHRVCKVCGVL